MNSILNWDEFRLVKAVAEARSLGGAAQILGVNHSTIFRRLVAIETAVGAKLFERSRSGYEPTPAGDEMVDLARSMGESIKEFERRVAGRDLKPSGELRVTTIDAFAVYLLPEILMRFSTANPEVKVELAITDQLLNLARREADVAIRATNKPTDTLVGRRVGVLRWCVYAPKRLYDELGAKACMEGSFVGFGDAWAATRGRRWLDARVSVERQSVKMNSTVAMGHAAAAGVGSALLPCLVGVRHPDLIAISEPIADLDVDMWILTHADLRYSARIRAFMDFVGAAIAELREVFAGAASSLTEP